MDASDRATILVWWSLAKLQPGELQQINAQLQQEGRKDNLERQQKVLLWAARTWMNQQPREKQAVLVGVIDRTAAELNPSRVPFRRRN